MKGDYRVQMHTSFIYDSISFPLKKHIISQVNQCISSWKYMISMKMGPSLTLSMQMCVAYIWICQEEKEVVSCYLSSVAEYNKFLLCCSVEQEYDTCVTKCSD